MCVTTRALPRAGRTAGPSARRRYVRAILFVLFAAIPIPAGAVGVDELLDDQVFGGRAHQGAAGAHSGHKVRHADAGLLREKGDAVVQRAVRLHEEGELADAGVDEDLELARRHAGMQVVAAAEGMELELRPGRLVVA